MKQLSPAQAKQHGIRTIHHEMDNEELRFRLVSEHGSSYVLTKSTSNNGWQASHVHQKKQEFYVLEKGFALFAFLVQGKVKLQKLCENESISIPVGVAHNVRLSDNAILHTLKFGTRDEDWESCNELDHLLREINTDDFWR